MRTSSEQKAGLSALAALAAVLTASLMLFLSSDLADLSGDSARYLLLARGLAEGRGYVDIEKPGMPPHTEYGPGLPLLLAPIVKIFGPGPGPAKTVTVAALVAMVALTFVLAREWDITASPKGSLGGDATGSRRDILLPALAALALAALPGLSRFANQVLSDLPYGALSIAALALAVRETRPGRDPGDAALALAGALAGAAFLVRQPALALWLGSVAALLAARDRAIAERLKSAAVFSAPFLLLAGAWLLRNRLAAGELDAAHMEKLFMARDADPFAGDKSVLDLAVWTLKGARDFGLQGGGILLDLAAPLAPKPLLLFLSVPGAALFVLGLVSRLARRPGPAEIYLALYLLIISAWQSHNPRYLLPALPLILLYAGAGASLAAGPLFGKLYNRPGPRDARRRSIIAVGGLYILMAALGVMVLFLDWRLVARAPVTPRDLPAASGMTSADLDALRDLAGEVHWGRWYQYADWVDKRDPVAIAMGYHRMLAGCAWMGRNLPEDAVVMARKPRIAAYYSDRKSVQFKAELIPAVFFERARRAGVTHLFVDETAREVRLVLASHLEKMPGAARPVFSLRGTMVLELTPDGGGSEGPPPAPQGGGG